VSETRSPFVTRHIGPTLEEQTQMAQVLGVDSLDEVVQRAIPAGIRASSPLYLTDFPQGTSEFNAQARFRAVIGKNQVRRSYLGAGYHGCITPAVIRRNVFENPGWYTQYTPYQPEISQGRLEALLNFQTMISELTGLPIANASLLDEGTAVAEAIGMCRSVSTKKGPKEVVMVGDVHPQTVAVVKTRVEPWGVKIRQQEAEQISFDDDLGVLVLQVPGSMGALVDWKPLVKQARACGAMIVVAADILSLALLEPLPVDVYVGSSQRFGVPMGCGGPHAAFFATREEFKRKIPGRLVGISRDARGEPALRLALQTREQHIRREKATSNICTAQVLLAVIAGMYGVYHGPDGLKAIAARVNLMARKFAASVQEAGGTVVSDTFFDTVQVRLGESEMASLKSRAEVAGINLRYISASDVCIAFDETVVEADLEQLCAVFQGVAPDSVAIIPESIPVSLARVTPFMQQDVFHRYRSETEMLRYIRRLESRDLSLCQSMIPLGSCTIKLNAAAEMEPVSWSEIANVHPFAPGEQLEGYAQMCADLERALAEITGFAGVSLQPNAGSQGEYAGLLAIRAYHLSNKNPERTTCLIPVSAHGTNPASAVMAGFKVVPVLCNDRGDIDLDDLAKKAKQYESTLGAVMVTYPSTHGVFEERIREVAEIVHANGGQVYMDGANMNAMVGVVKPAELGMDVCHLNLHKTFCIPHGGGGPGVGPIGVAEHLVPFLPSQKVTIDEDGVRNGLRSAVGPVSAAPWGSASILPITWMYICMMGGEGLTEATKVAILNANYIAKRLEGHYPVLYTNQEGWVAHECILDLRPLKALAGIEVDDVAKRLMDYGFHAPTVSWPVAGTVMIEPTESESKAELDRFCDAMISIRMEVDKIAQGIWSAEDNPLKGAPHVLAEVTADVWTHGYQRAEAAFPVAGLRSWKFWPTVARIDAAYGDRNLVCACGSVDDFATGGQSQSYNAENSDAVSSEGLGNGKPLAVQV
jgi:glycine dehydrogenase